MASQIGSNLQIDEVDIIIVGGKHSHIINIDSPQEVPQVQ